MTKKVAIIGIGYVGIHSVINLDKLGYTVVAYDINDEKISKFNNGIDVTQEVGNKNVKKSNALFTTDEKDLSNSDIFIVAVPTDINQKTKELVTKPLEEASKTIGKNIKDGAIVVYESTVYPGLTEEICIPIIEKNSGKKVRKDFNVVYTPERVDPGNKINTIKTTPRVIGGTSTDAVEEIIKMYSEYIPQMIKVSNLQTAEAVKILENTQRDINIALMNNFTVLMNKLDVNMSEVLDAAATKWNFNRYTPGLVGGHCIGIDTNYLIKKMKNEKIDTKFLEASRNINEDIIEYIYSKVQDEKEVNKILYVGASFKNNTNDIRNSKHIELINKLSTNYSIDVYDPLSDYSKTISINEINYENYDLVIVGVIHDEVDYSPLRTFQNNVNIFNLTNNKTFESTWELM